MAESMFSIFPDSHLTSGKGTVPRSKKKALCDVKNTLQSKRPGLNEPPRKPLLGQPSGKQLFKETPAKVTSKPEGTFTIACDQENEIFFDKCTDCKPTDAFPDVRPESSRLTNADCDFLAKGLWSMPVREPVTILQDDPWSLFGEKHDNWFDEELNIPPISDSELHYSEPAMLLSDGE